MRRWAPVLALLVVVGVHVALVLHFRPPSLIFADRPPYSYDWEMHYGQAKGALDAFRESGETWSYDPQRLAGMPLGVIFDADNKAWEVWTIGLVELGVPLPVAFNLFIWLTAFLVPLVLYASGRLFALGPGSAVLAAALGSLCFFFDAQAHWMSWSGMVSWAFAAYFWLLVLAVFWRWLASRSPWLLFGLLLLLSFLHLLHPYGFFLLVVPMGLLYLRAFRSLGWREHVGLAAVVLGTVVANLWWLAPTLRFWPYVLDSGFYLSATLDHLASDFLGLSKEPMVNGVISLRTGFRFLALGGAGAALWLWRRERDARLVPLGSALLALLALAYLGGYLGAVRQVQPYRFALAAMYAAVLPAAWFLGHAAQQLRREKLPVVAWLLLGLLAFTTLPRLARDVIYFFPEVIPRQTKVLLPPPPDINGGVYFGTIRWPDPFDWRLVPERALEFDAVTDYVRTTDDGRGRWLVEFWMLGERLAWSTDAQILGGFLEMNVAQTDANLFRRYLDKPPPTPQEIGEYLRQYNVRWIIVTTPLPILESRSELLRLETVVFGHRVYRVLAPPSFLEGEGPGEVRARLNHLEVRGTNGGSLVLKYHWLETLRCRPGCRLRRVTIPGDRVGFIGVESAPRDFEIYNGY